jgi:hypothetical protein
LRFPSAQLRDSNASIIAIRNDRFTEDPMRAVSG